MRRFMLIAVLVCAATHAFAEDAQITDRVEPKLPTLTSPVSAVAVPAKQAQTAAKERSVQELHAEVDSFGAMLRNFMLVGLGVGASLLLTLYGVKKFRGSGQSVSDRALQVRDSMWIAKGQRLLVVSVDGTEFLLAATHGKIRKLAMLKTPELDDAEPSLVAMNTPSPPAMLRAAPRTREETRRILSKINE